MADSRYRVIFKGEIAPDTKIDDVKLKVDFIFKTDPEKIKRLFSGEEVVVKKNAPLEVCEKIRDAFKNAGAIANILEEEKPVTVETETPQPKEPMPPPLPNLNEMVERKTVNEHRERRAEEKFCPACGELIQIKSLHCPYCGAKQKKEGMGCLPTGAIAVAIIMAFFIIAGILAAIAIPQFAAYRDRANKAGVKSSDEKTIEIDLKLLHETEEEYYQANNRYSNNLAELKFLPASTVTVEIVSADEHCFEAKGKIDNLEKTFWIDCEGEIYGK